MRGDGATVESPPGGLDGSDAHAYDKCVFITGQPNQVARICISLPDEMAEILEHTRPTHLTLSAHVRSLVYKGFEMERLEQRIIKSGLSDFSQKDTNAKAS